MVSGRARRSEAGTDQGRRDAGGVLGFAELEDGAVVRLREGDGDREAAQGRGEQEDLAAGAEAGEAGDGGAAVSGPRMKMREIILRRVSATFVARVCNP